MTTIAAQKKTTKRKSWQAWLALFIFWPVLLIFLTIGTLSKGLAEWLDD